VIRPRFAHCDHHALLASATRTPEGFAVNPANSSPIRNKALLEARVKALDAGALRSGLA
jgi:hypothetical protein